MARQVYRKFGGVGGPGDRRCVISSPSSVPVGRAGLQLFKRRARNRRVVVQRRAPLVVLADGIALIGRAFVGIGRAIGRAFLALVLGTVVVAGGRLGVEHVLASPRFAVREVQVSLTTHARRQEILSLAGVREGDRLLAVDTDVVARRVATHPWVASVLVRRQLPSVLSVDVVERRAAAAVSLGGLYLIDESGHPFKRATMDEVEGMPVLTGLERAQYGAMRGATEAAFREALAVLGQYRAQTDRPAVSEVNIDPRYGFTLFFLDGGTEVRLGRGGYGKKLARLDQILEAVKTASTVKVIHLDGTDTRVPVGLTEKKE